MGIPKVNDIMGPLLKELSDGKESTRPQLTEKLSEYFNLTEKEKTTLQPSGHETIFRNRVGWANYYLRKSGLTKSRDRGIIKITKKGLKALESGSTINKKFRFD